jgi:2,4-dienoyl-CoA reductase-like NADH-dependent reductase (Old Yellow Enzyme family)
MSPLLFEPMRLRSVTLRNRIVLSPMVTYSGRDGFITDWHLMHLGKFAAGGAGLVMMESTKIEPRGCSTIYDTGLWKDEFVEPLSSLTSFVKSFGASVGIQLSHTGRKARTSLPWEGRGPLTRAQAGDVPWNWELIGPSAIAHNSAYETPRELTRAQIEDLVEAWGAAAARADRAGFDVVEIHAAHGYLIHQFLSAHSNRRSDEYGGSLENRMRFALQVATRVRECWPEDKPLFMRISAVDEAGWSIQDSIALSRALKERGVDVIDCSAGGIGEGMNLATQRELRYGYQVEYAEAIRRAADIKTIAVGLIIHADQAEEILREQRADLVALGRELLHNPNWPLDAAQKLGHDGLYAHLPRSYGFWLEKRATCGFQGRPSTWQTGIEREPMT